MNNHPPKQRAGKPPSSATRPSGKAPDKPSRRPVKPGDSTRATVARAYMAFLEGKPFQENPPPTVREDAERRLYVQLLRGMVRHRRLLEMEVERFSGRPASSQHPAAAALALLGLFQLRFLDRIPAHAAVFETVALAQALGRPQAKGWLNALLRSAQRSLKSDEVGQEPPPPLAVRTSHPDAMVERWQKQYGKSATEKLCEANNHGGGISLRVETGRIDPEALVRRLADEGVAATRHPLLPGALEVEQAGALLRTHAFAEGLCYVQDVSSQVLAAWAAPILRGRVLDACCAPGGKLTLLSGLRHPDVHLTGADMVPGRLERVRENFSRLRLPPTPLLCADGGNLPFADASLDGVLLDVPCSATGMIRKYPELKWRWEEGALARQAVAQRRLLNEAARAVRSGGHILYVTCSLEPEENEQNVGAFLDDHPDFTRLPFHSLAAPRGLGEPVTRFVTKAGDFLMLPTSNRMGMYGAMLRRGAADRAPRTHGKPPPRKERKR